MRGVDRQQSLLKPELAQQSLDCRDFIGLCVLQRHKERRLQEQNTVS
jgi:hypothetical protein